MLRLNWCATIALNYKSGGTTAVLRMPIKVYGRLRWHVEGKIILPDNAIRNTLIIGSEHEDYSVSAGRAELNILGTWKVKGIVRLGPDSFIGVKKEATLETGDGCMFARDTQIHCSKCIVFENDIIAGELYATDSTEHRIVRDGREQPMNSDIFVGKGTYLGYRCVLLKGCRIPQSSVVASCAVCNRDYSQEGNEKLFIAGVPAIVKARDVSALK